MIAHHTAARNVGGGLLQRNCRATPFGSAGRLARRPATQQQCRVRASSEQQQAAASTTQQQQQAAVEYVPDADFNISKVSFGSILTPLGVVLMSYGFGAYFGLLPGFDVSSLMLIYGFPISILGFALSYAQLEPVPCRTTAAALALRGSQMTDIQKQVREDTTRYRYGDEQHLDEALNRIWLFGRAGNPPKKSCPRLIGLREETVDGAYTLTLEFDGKLELQQWQDRLPKVQTFFGPGIVARVQGTAAGVDVQLVSDGSGAGRGGGDRPEVLPPLLPGLPARQSTLDDK